MQLVDDNLLKLKFELFNNTLREVGHFVAIKSIDKEYGRELIESIRVTLFGKGGDKE